MGTLLLIILALAPVAVIVLYVWFRDKYDKEPFKLIVFGLFLGAIATIPAIILELLGNSLFPRFTMFNVFLYSFFVVALSEEGVKFLVLRKIFYRKPDFNEPYDGIMYSVVISMGFAGAENLLYVLNNGVEVGVLRMFTAVPAHAGFAILMGYFVGKAKFSLRYKNYYCFIGLFNAILFHGLYDFFLLQQNYAALQYFAFIALIVCLILSFRALNKRRKHLFLKNSSEENSENSNSSLP